MTTGNFKIIECPNCEGIGGPYKGPGSESQKGDWCIADFSYCSVCRTGSMVICYNCKGIRKINMQEILECQECGIKLDNLTVRDLDRRSACRPSEIPKR
jgi:hypothetical protein